MNIISIILINSLLSYSNYEKVLLVEDFNTKITEHYIESFLYEHALSNLVKEKTCFKKNYQNPSCTDFLYAISASHDCLLWSSGLP